MLIKKLKHFHMCCGLGGGAKGFNNAKPRVGNVQAHWECLGGIDVDPAGLRDFERLAGVPGTLMDLFTRDQYTRFHGTEPPAGWREARRAELAPQVRELAKTLNISQIAARLGVSRRMLDTIGRDYQITYKPAPTGAQLAAMERDRVFAERLKAFHAIGLTKREACMRSGLGYAIFNRVCKAYGLQFPKSRES